jgi:pimeloyl-ACP methyl ester carboxylesterase
MTTFSAAEREQHLRDGAARAGLELEEIVLPAERRLTANGLEFHYLDWGTPGLTPVLFLHGGGLNAHTWDLTCLALRQSYHCLALDQRGHGDTDWSPTADYSLEAHRGDVEAVVEQLGLNHFLLVGMSMGGAASLAYAGRHADRLAGLVLVDIGPDGRDAGRHRIASFVSGPREMDSVDDFVQRALEFNPRRRPELLRRSLLHNLRQTPEGKWTWKYDYRRYEAMSPEYREQRRAALWSAVPNVTCPTLVVRGAQSDVFHDEDAEKLVAALPDARWVRIEGAGHTVQGDQPKRLVEALRPFFEQVLGR